MKYKNRRTKNVIDINGILTGGEWEEVKTPSTNKEKKPEPVKTVRKKTGTEKRVAKRNG